MKTKVPWLVFGNAKTRWQNAKTQLQDLKKSIIAEEDKLKKFKTPMVKANDEQKLAGVKQQKTKATRKALAKKQNDIAEELNDLGMEVEGKVIELENARTKASQRDRKIKVREKELRDAEAARARTPPVPDEAEEIAELKETRITLNTDLRNVDDELDALNGRLKDPENTVTWGTKQLQSMNSVRGQRVNNAIKVAKRQHLPQFDAWVLENKNYFVKPVLGPVLTLMECNNTDHRNMLAHALPNYSFGMYICQTRADYDKVAPLALKYGIDVSIIESVNYRPPDISHLLKHGVTHTLDMVFDAPAVVKQLLCVNHAIHKSFVLKKMAGEQIERIFKETEIMRALTPDTVMNKNVSHWDKNAISIQTNELRRGSQIFTGGVDPAEKAAMQKRVEAANKQIQTFAAAKADLTSHKRKLETEIGEKLNRIKSLGAITKTARDRLKQLEKAVNTAKLALERASTTMDVAAIERRVNEELKGLTKKRVEACLSLVDVTTQLAEKTHELTKRSLRCKELEVQVAYFKGEFNKANGAAAAMRAELDPLTTKVRFFLFLYPLKILLAF